ncbi:MAG: hypothetical protein J0I21_05290 [Alphaproteobacteria bacterium]|nr:hypothetical protein [Alphaproteobacteria bacterium]
MRRFLLSLAVLAGFAAPALAATSQRSDQTSDNTAYAARASTAPADVPAHLMTPDGTLINGLLPNSSTVG